jgi:hypothetical protein
MTAAGDRGAWFALAPLRDDPHHEAAFCWDDVRHTIHH